MIRRPPRSTLDRSSAASDVYKRQVLKSGALIAAGGIGVGAVGGFILSRVATSYVAQVQMPGVIVVAAAGAVLLVAAVGASLMPAARAARTNVLEALRAE